MKIDVVVLGKPLLYGYGNHELETLPKPGQEISLPAFQRKPIRFYVDSVMPGTKPKVMLKINENIARLEVAKLCALYFHHPE